jgi:hypothetical protein
MVAGGFTIGALCLPADRIGCAKSERGVLPEINMLALRFGIDAGHA